MSESGISGVEQAGDLAFLLSPADAAPISQSSMAFVEQHRRKLVGLNRNKVVFGMDGREQQKLGIIAAACRVLAEQDGVRFLLLPHDIPDGLDDVKTFQDRLGEMHCSGLIWFHQYRTARLLSIWRDSVLMSSRQGCISDLLHWAWECLLLASRTKESSRDSLNCWGTMGWFHLSVSLGRLMRWYR